MSNPHPQPSSGHTRPHKVVQTKQYKSIQSAFNSITKTFSKRHSPSKHTPPKMHHPHPISQNPRPRTHLLSTQQVTSKDDAGLWGAAGCCRCRGREKSEKTQGCRNGLWHGDLRPEQNPNIRRNPLTWGPNYGKLCVWELPSPPPHQTTLRRSSSQGSLNLCQNN